MIVTNTLLITIIFMVWRGSTHSTTIDRSGYDARYNHFHEFYNPTSSVAPFTNML